MIIQRRLKNVLLFLDSREKGHAIWKWENYDL